MDSTRLEKRSRSPEVSVQNQRCWSLLILLASCSLPLSVRVAPKVTLQPDVESSISCVGCNPLVFGQPLDINKAPIEHLLSLPYIGQKRARDIIRHRTTFGDFETFEDLDDVPGIGPKTLMRLQPYIVIE